MEKASDYSSFCVLQHLQGYEDMGLFAGRDHKGKQPSHE